MLLLTAGTVVKEGLGQNGVAVDLLHRERLVDDPEHIVAECLHQLAAVIEISLQISDRIEILVC
jgi:hypothetical protein